MKDTPKFIILFFSLILTLFSNSTIACTIISASDGETVLFGGNEDQSPNESYLVVDKRGKLGVIYFATPWKELPLVMQMGINEKGLCFDYNWIPTEALTSHPERIPMEQMKLIQEVASVDEVLSRVFNYDFGDSMNYQVHIADKSGDAAVIHPGTEGELTYSRKSKGNGYLISTNFNLAQLDKGNWSCSRYKIADKMLSKIGGQRDLTVESMASVLNATHQDRLFSVKTIYSAIYDLKKLIIYLYYERQFNKPYVLDVKRELAKTKRYRKVSLKELISKNEMEKNEK